MLSWTLDRAIELAPQVLLMEKTKVIYYLRYLPSLCRGLRILELQPPAFLTLDDLSK
jgi:hypothetical protein